MHEKWRYPGIETMSRAQIEARHFPALKEVIEIACEMTGLVRQGRYQLAR